MERINVFLDALKLLNSKLQATAKLAYLQILIGIYFDLGGRIPNAIRYLIDDYKTNFVEIVDILCGLIEERIYFLVKKEQVDEKLIINSLTFKINNILEDIFEIALMQSEIDKEDTSISGKIDIGNIGRVKLWWDIISEKTLLSKDNIRIELQQKELYYYTSISLDYICCD